MKAIKKNGFLFNPRVKKLITDLTYFSREDPGS